MREALEDAADCAHDHGAWCRGCCRECGEWCGGRRLGERGDCGCGCGCGCDCGGCWGWCGRVCAALATAYSALSCLVLLALLCASAAGLWRASALLTLPRPGGR